MAEKTKAAPGAANTENGGEKGFMEALIFPHAHITTSVQLRQGRIARHLTPCEARAVKHIIGTEVSNG